MRVAGALLLTYLLAVVVAGHGGLPMAVLLVMGDAQSWWFGPRLLGWSGLAAVMAATVAFRSAPALRRRGQLGAAALLYLSWLWTALLGRGESGSFWSSLVLSAPLQLTFLVVGVRAIVLSKAQQADKGRAAHRGRRT